MSINLIQVTGNLVADPISSATTGGYNKCTFRIAHNKIRKDNEKEVIYYDCTAWEKTGEFCQRNLRKGMKVLVYGEPKCKPYIGKDGQAHGNIMVNCQNVEFFAPAEKKDEDIKAAAEKAMADDIAGITDIPF